MFTHEEITGFQLDEAAGVETQRICVACERNLLAAKMGAPTRRENQEFVDRTEGGTPSSNFRDTSSRRKLSKVTRQHLKIGVGWNNKSIKKSIERQASSRRMRLARLMRMQQAARRVFLKDLATCKEAHMETTGAGQDEDGDEDNVRERFVERLVSSHGLRATHELAALNKEIRELHHWKDSGNVPAAKAADLEQRLAQLMEEAEPLRLVMDAVKSLNVRLVAEAADEADEADEANEAEEADEANEANEAEEADEANGATAAAAAVVAPATEGVTTTAPVGDAEMKNPNDRDPPNGHRKMLVEEWFRERTLMYAAKICRNFCLDLLNPTARPLMTEQFAKAVDDWADALEQLFPPTQPTDGDRGDNELAADTQMKPLRNLRTECSQNNDNPRDNDGVRRKRFYPSASGVAFRDPKSVSGMLNIALIVVDSKFDVQDILAQFISHDSPPVGFNSDGEYIESAGMIEGDQLTIDRWLLALKDILSNGVWHDDIKVRMAAYIYSELMSKMALEAGNFHITQANRHALMILEDQVTVPSLLCVTKRGDKVDRTTVTKRLQTTRFLQQTEVDGRLYAAFLHAIENGDMPCPADLFREVGADDSRSIDVYRLSGVLYKILHGKSDTTRFLGSELLKRHAIANEWEECVRHHDAEGLSVLPLIGLPLMAAAEKPKYMEVLMGCRENELFGAPAITVARWYYNTHNLESLNHGVATDAILEDSMLEGKPAFKTHGLLMFEAVTENYRLLSALKNSYRDSVQLTRVRGVRSHKVTRRLKNIVSYVRLFTHAGVANYTRDISTELQLGIINRGLHHAAQGTSKIGDAVTFERRKIDLRSGELPPRFQNDVGSWTVIRAEGSIDGEDAVLVLEPSR